MSHRGEPRRRQREEKPAREEHPDYFWAFLATGIALILAIMGVLFIVLTS